MATETATPPRMTLDRSSGTSTLDLYRAALGPVHTDHYLKTFTRFDAAGKAGPSWNWAAALLTLNWLLFRQLWLAALAYVAAVTTGALLVFGIGALVVALPEAGQWAVLAGFVLLACAVPGALGNAWLYAASTRKMQAALSASATTAEACNLLRLHASGRRQLGGLAAANVLLLAAVAALVWNWPRTSALPLNTSRMEQARSAPALTLESGLAAKNVAANASAAASAAPPPAAPATAPASAPTPAPVSAPASAPMAAAIASAPASAPASASAPPATKPTKPAKKPTAPTEPAAHAEPDTYLINVGLFADSNNARNAYTKLRDAGLRAIQEETRTHKGTRTRVRAGPYDSAAEADRVADKIRALGLDAVVLPP